MKKRIAYLLSLIMVLGSVASYNVTIFASNYDAESLELDSKCDGLLEETVDFIPEDEAQELHEESEEEIQGAVEEDPENVINVESEVRDSSAYNNQTWDKYSSYYYYNKLSPEKKAVWDRLYTTCNNYLSSSSVDAIENNGIYYTTEVAGAGGMSVDEFKELYRVFRYSNPQFYFLMSRWATYRRGDVYYILPAVYDDFADGNARNAGTQEFLTAVSDLMSNVPQNGTDLQKVKAAHDAVVTSTYYNKYGAQNNNDNAVEQSEKTQTAYSAAVMGRTVCAGYAQLFELLCNGMGIDAIAITSTHHEWNIIRVGDSWYNVDCTWDDAGTGEVSNDPSVRYLYFMESTAGFTTKDTNAHADASQHVVEDLWNVYIPPQRTLSIGSTNNTAGTSLPASRGRVATPTITAESTSSGVRVSLSDTTAGATIYYTTDGSNPSSAFSKSTMYNGTPFTVTSGTNVKAMAVLNEYTDSGTASEKLINNNSQSKPDSKPARVGTVQAVNSDGQSFTKDSSGDVRCYNKDGSQVKNDFKCDGVSTYFFQADGTAMKDRLTYHPDGVHVIYFDDQGHEVFSSFAHVKKSIANEDVNDYCFFDVWGHLYVDVLTYDQLGQKIYYANPYGVLEVDKWFQFSDNVKWADGTPADSSKNQFGYAQYDGTLLTNSWTYDFLGRWCYMQGNGVAAY